MADHDQLLRQARSELMLGGGTEPIDLRLWEHGLRVMTSAEMVAQLPEMTGQRIDREALRVAALYHDAGWAVQVEVSQITREQVLTRPTNDVQFELAAELVESSLSEMLPANVVRRAGDVIRSINNRGSELTEAHIVSDADNLDLIGPLGFVQNLRRDLAEGRALQQVLDTWYRQQEYHYWEARIRDGMRIESVRELAWQRLRAMDPFMQALGEHLEARDLAELLGSSTAPRRHTAS